MKNEVDFKDLEEKDYPVKKLEIIMMIVSSLLITFIYQFNIEGYFFEGIMPFIIVLINYLVLFKDKKKNKKAYFLLIPIFLIMISDLIIGIDSNNKLINVFVLPLLIVMFMFLLINKNYKLEGDFFTWIIKVFPEGLFSNLKFIKAKKDKKDEESDRTYSVLLGLGAGISVGSIMIYLLSKADDYFSAFIDKVIENITNIDASSFFIFVGSFILIFSIFINFLKHQNDKMNDIKLSSIDKTVVTIFLGIINFIFTLFLISEISRLTNNFLALPVRYTYSSYAREGFFQLLFVTLMNYGIITFLLYKTELVKKEKIVRIMLLTLILFSSLLVFNSYYRMGLYINHYGFTVLRLQVILFLLMELIFFILMTLRIFNRFRNKNSFVYFVIMLSFYILNLYICNDFFISYFGL